MLWPEATTIRRAGEAGDGGGFRRRSMGKGGPERVKQEQRRKGRLGWRPEQLRAWGKFEGVGG